jgi:hypothetical protein
LENACQVGDVTITLAWDDRNDLDLHVHVQPHGQTSSTEIYYANRQAAGGSLDVVIVSHVCVCVCGCVWVCVCVCVCVYLFMSSGTCAHVSERMTLARMLLRRT